MLTLFQQAIEMIDLDQLADLLIRLICNLITISILVRYIYYNYRKNEEFAFTFFLFNVLIFFVCYMMSGINLTIGFAFGLFAIFGILRYRTITIPIKEMTYLFAAITIALINSVNDQSLSLVTIVTIDVFLVLFVFVMEKLWYRKNEQYKTIQYEKIELIEKDKRAELIQDLKERTSLDVTRVEIKSINFINDSAELRVYFVPENN